MARTIRLGLALLGLGLLLLLWHGFAPPPPASTPASPMASPPADGSAVLQADAAAPVATDQPAAAGGTTRRGLAPDPAPDTATLLVTTVWQNDRTPATGVRVGLHRSDADPLFERPTGTTDATGQHLFADLAPGKVTPTWWRGETEYGKSLLLVAGQRAEITLQIPTGMSARGRVVDELGHGVADAEIVIAGWGGGRAEVIGHSAGDGSFDLRGVACTCHIGARKPGHRPSAMRTFTTAEGAEVEFTILLVRGGGAIAGTVFDPAGTPVAGAVVRAGSTEQGNHNLPDGGNAMAPQCEYVRTDAAGRFLVASTLTGSVPLAVRDPGLAPWRQDVAVDAGRTTEVAVHLQHGATLTGRAVDRGGEPLAAVSIRVGEWRDLGNRSVRTAADGSYHLDGLAAGSSEAIASHDDHGTVRATLELIAGAAQRWDPVLGGGLQLRGRVLDENDRPVASVMVEADPDPRRAGDRWHGFASTDAEGHFVLRDVPEGRTLHLSFRRRMFPELHLDGVQAGADELQVRLPRPAWVHMRGSVRGPDGTVLANVTISPHLQDSRSGTPVETVDPATGAFELGPYPPGSYTLRIAAAGQPTLRLQRTLAPDETWDLGEVHFPRGGTLAVQLVGDRPMGPDLRASLYDAQGRYVTRLELAAGAGRSEPLVPGDYELQVSGKDSAAATPFTIRADRETRLDLPLLAAEPVAIEVTGPAETVLTGSVQVVVRDAAGRVCWRGNAWRRDDAPRASCLLPKGSYRVEASWRGLRGAGSVEVAGATSVTVALVPE